MNGPMSNRWPGSMSLTVTGRVRANILTSSARTASRALAGA
ncbi:MAG TPA: hypothetical protein VEL02_07175 [Jatrophihabitantaceae bacterium]|nr:hypothetical protein [Jatrophihabitantaceae bacterium]